MAVGATCTKPITITDAYATSDSVSTPSPGETAWTAGTYNLGDQVVIGVLTGTVTISNANPAVVSWASNIVPNGAPLVLSTTGALPAGLTAGRVYYVVNRASGTLQLSETVGGAPVATTSAGSGVHTARVQIHRKYESAEASNSGTPTLDPVKWLDIGPTNQWAKYDIYRPTVTWGASPMTFQITPGRRVRQLFLGNLNAESARVVVKVGGVTKYDKTVSLYSRKTTNPTDFCFAPWARRSDVQFADLPLYGNPVIEVTLTRSTGMVAVGEVVIGNPVFIGKVELKPKRGSRNFTKFDRRSDGTPTPPIRQRNVPTLTFSTFFDRALIGNMMALGEEIDGEIVLFVCASDSSPYFSALTILGLATTFEVDADGTNETARLNVVAEEY